MSTLPSAVIAGFISSWLAVPLAGKGAGAIIHNFPPALPITGLSAETLWLADGVGAAVAVVGIALLLLPLLLTTMT